MTIRYLSVCSGIEAASVAWEPLGWKAVGYSEIEPFPCAVLAHHFPTTPNYGSLTEYKSWPLEPGAIDLLVGGCPCQSFSVAGLRKGLEDTRGNLTLTFLALADHLKPKWIVYENVPGLLSINGGRDFGAFLGALVQLGYGFAYRVLDAQHFGVPQRRRRVFVVACLGDWESAAAVLSLGEGLRRHIEAGGKKRKATPPDAGSGVGAGILWSGSDQANAERVIDKAGTLNCDRGQRGGFIVPLTPIVIDRAAFNQGQNALYEPCIEESETMPSLVARGPHAVVTQQVYENHPMAVRRLTPIECERLQGFPDNWTQIPWRNKPASDCPDGPRYKACGNSMAVPVMRWIGEQIARVEASQNI